MMIRRSLSLAAVAAGLVFGGAAVTAPHRGHDSTGATQNWRRALQAAINSDARNPANIARDRYRHPFETLAFFGVKPGDTVVEIWPGGGWYTEILAPYAAH